MVPNHQPAIKITIKSPMEKEAPECSKPPTSDWDALGYIEIGIDLCNFWVDDTDSSNRKLTLNNTQQQE